MLMGFIYIWLSLYGKHKTSTGWSWKCVITRVVFKKKVAIVFRWFLVKYCGGDSFWGRLTNYNNLSPVFFKKGMKWMKNNKGRCNTVKPCRQPCWILSGWNPSRRKLFGKIKHLSPLALNTSDSLCLVYSVIFLIKFWLSAVIHDYRAYIGKQ